jgi:hypothetical protein
MSGAQRSLPWSGDWSGDDVDVARLMHVLEKLGPLPMGDLAAELDHAGWPAARVEHAIVSAWSRALIFIDRGDRLVAIGTPTVR